MNVATPVVNSDPQGPRNAGTTQLEMSPPVDYSDPQGPRSTGASTIKNYVQQNFPPVDNSDPQGSCNAGRFYAHTDGETAEFRHSCPLQVHEGCDCNPDENKEFVRDINLLDVEAFTKVISNGVDIDGDH